MLLAERWLLEPTTNRTCPTTITTHTQKNKSIRITSINECSTTTQTKRHANIQTMKTHSNNANTLEHFTEHSRKQCKHQQTFGKQEHECKTHEESNNMRKHKKLQELTSKFGQPECTTNFTIKPTPLDNYHHKLNKNELTHVCTSNSTDIRYIPLENVTSTSTGFCSNRQFVPTDNLFKGQTTRITNHCSTNFAELLFLLPRLQKKQQEEPFSSRT